MIDLAIIGAGPYGLSIAAHLKRYNAEFRIFGSPMRNWLAHMPQGMLLKSEGFASSLYDPDSALTLKQYCKEKGLPYADVGRPVPKETFCSYGLAFQEKFVSELENKQVVALRKSARGFTVELGDGEVVEARRVVIAVGLSYFDYVPPILSGLPREFVTHSSRHSTLNRFAGREVIVVGAGASALDLAALLHQAGASVQLVARKPVIRFQDPPDSHVPSAWERLRHPMTGIGNGWRSVFLTEAPVLFRQLPERRRLDAVKRILGPAPGWFIKDQVVGKVPFNLGVDITQASVRNGAVNLQLTDGAGVQRTLAADHVIAATGYRVDLRRLTFLNTDVLAGIRSVEQTPVLSSNFESSVPGLYFVGTAAANTFGPVLRFAFGAGFTARRVSRHLARTASRSSRRTGSAVADLEMAALVK